MTFKEYVTIKNPIGSTTYIRSFINRFKIDENTDLNGINGLGKKARSLIIKLQVKYKGRSNK